jgi:hypothetical protein
MIKDNNYSISNNSCLSDVNTIGHLFITIKFFKFTEKNHFNENTDELRVNKYIKKQIKL